MGKTFHSDQRLSFWWQNVQSLSCFPFPSSSDFIFHLITDSSSPHFFPLISQHHIFLFNLTYTLLLAVLPTSRRPPPFTFCSFQTVWPAGHWRSGRWPAAPPSSWRGWRTGWCRCRTPSSSRIPEGRSRSRPPGRCSWNGGTPPYKEKPTPRVNRAWHFIFYFYLLLERLRPGWCFHSPVSISYLGGLWGHVWAGCCPGGAPLVWGGNPDCRSQCYGCG